MSEQPILDKRIKDHTGYGLLSVFTGDGRGKTTAGLGTAVRACAAGKRVAIVYFDKGGTTHYSERKLLDQMGIDWFATGRDRIDPVTGRFDFSVLDVDKLEAKRGIEIVKNLFVEAQHDLVVLDEINCTVSLGMLPEEDTLQILSIKPDSTELILTGRNAPKRFLDLAHLVTEMTLKKHYFYSGVPAREGVDY